PNTADLMPAVLELLKREKEMKTQGITIHMRRWIKRNRFDDRDLSIAWALNRLKKEDYVVHPGWGTWGISERGLGHTLTPEESREIVERWTQRESAARKSKRAGRQPKM
ncbi:MAG: hypothetical protein ABSB35_32755, partial [Bryobacteraceae bacterium]